ncbi:MAG: chitobiase/beta-hexosaminidase C-terminal domain-containing protein [Lachnospiraceae bacterium]|nr:chitobiase/beta-hexosaminidase C-terminal domain-containing protein [Lachnospiraceae bacterium]
MNCPKCGRPLKEGMLYCEHCGGEVNLVPEFDAQVEESIAAGMQTVVDDGFEHQAPEADTEEQREPAPSHRRIFVWLTVGLLTAVLIALSVRAVIYMRHRDWYDSAQEQISSAREYTQKEAYDSAEACYLRALELEPDNISCQLELADLYVGIGREDEALQIYRSVILSEVSSAEEKLTACQGFVDYYSADDDYRSIAQFLEELDNEELQTAFSDYLAEPVTFSQPEGIFTDLVTLKLTADESGSIYYTLDGSTPDESSELYTSPLYLEEGTTVVSAVYINLYGVKSTVTKATYVVDTATPYQPEIYVYSGSYTYPLEISAEAEEGCSIYYTIDGGVPNASSSLYYEGLFASEGTHTYRFVAVSEAGLVSDVITRTFTVNLSGEAYSSSQAWNLLVAAQMEAGVISDSSGTVEGHPEYVYIYQYLFPISIEGNSEYYYLFAEVNRETAGASVGTYVQHRTGMLYGVSAATGQVVRVTLSGGTYSISG